MKRAFNIPLILIVVLLLKTNNTNAQVSMFQSYEDYKNRTEALQYAEIRETVTNNFIVIDNTGMKKKINRNNIWGYQLGNDSLFRVWNRTSLKVDAIHPSIVIYYTTTDESIVLENMVIPQSGRNYYFSSSLNGEITALTSASLAQHYHFTQPQLNKIKSLSKTDKITKKNPATGTYYLLEEVFQ
jgi:hypothetical protein